MTDIQVLGNSLTMWGVAIGVAIVPMATLTIARRVLGGSKRRPAPPLDAEYRSLMTGLARTWTTLGSLSLGIFAMLGVLDLPAKAQVWTWRVGVGLLSIQGLVWVRVLSDWLIRRYLDKHRLDDGQPDPAVQGASGTLRWISLFVLYACVVLLALDNMGVDVTALVAGLGIGGIAVALALQNVLSDLFASLSITLDKPFVVGDFIVVGTEVGTIERIGIKTTRVRSLSGEQLVFSNNDLLTARIRNFKRMQERRIVFQFGVTYQTTPEQLEAITPLVREVFAKVPGTRLDRCHFFRFGAFSLDFEVVYFVASAEYNAYMDAQQAINLAIARGLASMNVEFAYPTQTLFLRRDGNDQGHAEQESRARTDGSAQAFTGARPTL